ncbi:PEPxxWA-CTERM sorting domain-containing protein [Sandarakinorhabdus oryzae]|uniref:PEPxxWA-CTERM sorting domain-containing protein n=1 Tax=Sandarakinorhabdus oryzae TaxID=2675220 RepID=UPI001F1869E9|nr:PEPxxWA-CTERM sorting domain-containing protein [Sandarakinorhabdus oryzae]
MFRFITAAAVGVAAFAMPSVAAAQTVGSASFATQRNCNLVSGTQACDGTGPGQGIANGQYGGGTGVGGLNMFEPQPGNYAWSDVRFTGELDLPTIRAATQAGGDVRMNINTFAFQSYTWNGAAPTDFSITGALHIVDSSTSPSGGALPGGSIFTSYVGIWDPSTIAGLTTPQQLFNSLFYADCGTPGVLGVGSNSGVLTGGDASFTATTAACGLGSLTLNPGQSVLVVVGLQLPVNRGGFVDASHTFSTRLGDNLAPEQKDAISASLTSAISQGAIVTGVPEPASWAMLIAGFGLVGATLRKRRAALA